MPRGGHLKMNESKADPIAGPAFAWSWMGYGWAWTTGLRSPAQVSVFFTRA